MAIMFLSWEFSFKVRYYKASKNKESRNRIKYVSVNFQFVSFFVCLRLEWSTTFNVSGYEINQQ